MRPYTKRGSYLSRVLAPRMLSLREARERVAARRGPHVVVIETTNAPPVRGVVSVLSTWGLVAKFEAAGLRDLALGRVLGPEWRVVLDPETDPREGRGTLASVEAIPGGYRVEIRLKSPLRMVAHPARSEA